MIPGTEIAILERHKIVLRKLRCNYRISETKKACGKYKIKQTEKELDSLTL